MLCGSLINRGEEAAEKSITRSREITAQIKTPRGDRSGLAYVGDSDDPWKLKKSYFNNGDWDTNRILENDF